VLATRPAHSAAPATLQRVKFLPADMCFTSPYDSGPSRKRLFRDADLIAYVTKLFHEGGPTPAL
jgi:hypothetical protein